MDYKKTKRDFYGCSYLVLTRNEFSQLVDEIINKSDTNFFKNIFNEWLMEEMQSGDLIFIKKSLNKTDQQKYRNELVKICMRKYIEKHKTSEDAV